MNPIVRQLEYYLSDVNLQKDEFTRNLLKEHNNEIPLELFNTTFKRMQDFKEPTEKVAEVINKHSKHLHINEKMEVVLNRPPEDKLICVTASLQSNPFKFPNVISYTKEGNQYTCYFYEQSEADEFAEEFKEAAKEKSYVKGLIAKITNVPESVTREDFYSYFEQFGEVRFVDYFKGNDFACVRFREGSPEAVAHAVAYYAEKPLEVNGEVLKVEKLSEEEERATWDKILAPKLEEKGKKKRNFK